MKSIAYLRVSTARQGQSGLGIEAQRQTVADYAKAQGIDIIAEYVEHESGKRSDRPQLREALDHARRANAQLTVAKIDRLSRDAAFLAEIRASGAKVAFCDLPEVGGVMGEFMVGLMGQIAQLEAGMISDRTKAALAAAKVRGVRLGNPDKGAALVAWTRENGNHAAVEARQKAAHEHAEAYRSSFAAMVEEGLGLRAMARELNAKGETTPKGSTWTPTAVKRTLDRLELAA